MKSFRSAILMLTAVSALAISVSAQDQSTPAPAPAPAPAPVQGGSNAAQQQTPQFERQRPIRAANMTGKVGEVTEAAPDHYMIRTSAKESYRINITEHTRIVGGAGHIRQTPPPPTGEAAANVPSRAPQGGMVPSTIPASAIVAGDYITTVGEVDPASPNTVNASMIAKLDEERVKQLKEREAEFGKSWLSGRITAISGTTITLNGSVDGAPHNILVDENTSLMQRRDPATLADFHVGDMIRVDGTGTQGSDFHATKVSAMNGRMLNGIGVSGSHGGTGTPSPAWQAPAPMAVPAPLPPPAPAQTPQ